MRFNIILSAIFFLIISTAASAFQADVVLLHSETGNRTADTVAADCVSELHRILECTGRLYPEDYRRAESLFPDGLFTAEKIADAHEKTGIRRFWIVTVVQDSTRIYAVLDMIDAKSPGAKKSVRVSSGIIQNLSLLLCREIVTVMGRTDITAPVLGEKKNTRCVIGAGQWHGLSEGMRYDSDAGSFTTVKTGRFSSVAVFEKEPQASSIVIFRRPDTDALFASLDSRIRDNIVKNRGIGAVLLKDDPAPGKRLLVATTLINSGASLFLPGYGSYLSVSYMGFQNPRPAYAGIFMGFSAEMVQLCAVPLMTDGFMFRSLVPWTDGGHRSREQKRLQIFLWSALPMTWASTFFDQLAEQYDHERVLPPAFENADSAAAVSSLFIPGGGLFYKGYRAAGWGYYTAEMIAGSTAAYAGRGNTRTMALAALVLLKGAEIATSFFLRPAYSFYNKEYERETRAVLDFSFAEDRGKLTPRIAAVLRF